MAFLYQAMASSIWPLSPQRNAQVVVGLGVLRVEFDGLPVAGDGLVQLALVRSAMPRLLWADGELRVEFDGLPVAGDGLVQLALATSALPRLSWAMANFGSSSMAFL